MGFKGFNPSRHQLKNPRAFGRVKMHRVYGGGDDRVTPGLRRII